MNGGKYEDLLSLPHHVSETRPHMSRSDRAAQFSAFAALTGFNSVISETGRRTETRIEPDEYALETLNAQLQALQNGSAPLTDVTATYFVADARKEGGAYVAFTGTVRRIDAQNGVMLFENGTCIHFEDLLELRFGE